MDQALVVAVEDVVVEADVEDVAAAVNICHTKPLTHDSWSVVRGLWASSHCFPL